MASTTLKGNPVKLAGEFPEKGAAINQLNAVKQDLSELTLGDYQGKRKVLNIFPSIDTDICATSVRTFNQKAAGLEDTAVICLSFDLPFAHKRFCGAEGIEGVVTGSLYRDSGFASGNGLLIEDGPLKGLTARAVIVLDGENRVLHAELVGDIASEPDYDEALAVL